MHALGVLVDGRLKADIVRYPDQAELIVLPAPNSLEVQPTDFTHRSGSSAKRPPRAGRCLLRGAAARSAAHALSL